MRLAFARSPVCTPVSTACRRICLVLATVSALTACGSLEWPPSSSVPQLATHPSRGTSQWQRQTGGMALVRSGDTLYSVSQRHNVSLRALIETNHLSPPYTVYPGQRLVLPARREHVVVRGDTLYGISRTYGVDMSSLARVNHLGPPYEIAVGQRLQIPGQITPPPMRVEPARVSVPRPAPNTRTASAPRVPLPAPPRGSGGFAWPLNGKLLSSYGPKSGGLHNDGINIAAAKGTPVRASQSGVVAYAGNELRGFGNLLLLRHSGGWITAYAHNETLLVHRGDRVRKGQVIARVGNSGNVVSPQLHFEIRRGKQAVDPTDHLGTQLSSG